MFGLLIRAIRNTNVTSFHLKVFLIDSYFFASHCLTFNKTRSRVHYTQGASLSTGGVQYSSDRKKYGNDALNELVLLVLAMRNADRQRMQLIGLTDTDLSENDFKFMIRALGNLVSLGEDEGQETLEINQVGKYLLCEI